MLSRELKLAAAMTAASILLSFVSYKILLAGTYLAGIAALIFAVLVVIFSSFGFHVIHRRRVALPVVHPVSAGIGSATSIWSGNAIRFPAIAGSFAVIILSCVIVSGEMQRQVIPEMSATRSQSTFGYGTISFA